MSESESRDAAMEEALAFLRAKGLSIVASMWVVQRLTGMPLDEVKRLVHFSRAWDDMRETHEQFHADLARAAERIAREADDIEWLER